jgi:preprotein translocase subunit SecD
MTSRNGLAVVLAAACLATGCSNGHRAAPRTQPFAVRVEVPGADARTVAAVGAVVRRRLDAFGLGLGQPAIAGTVVTIGVPRALTTAEADGLRRPGVLRFRPVLQSFAADAPPPPTPAADCTTAADRVRLGEAAGTAAHDAEVVVACDADGGAKYLLGPAERTDVETATAAADEGPGGTSTWIVRLELKDAGRWRDLTAKYTGKQLAIVLDGAVQSAPQILDAIPDGTAQVSGSFTEADARALAAILQYGALPAPVVVTAG